MRKFWILRRVLLAAALTAGLSSCAAKQPAKVAPGAVENMAYEDIPTLNNDQAVVYKDVTPDFVLTYAENQTEDYPTTQAGYRFAQLVNLRSRGKIQVRLHADAVLGDEASTVKQLRIGGIDLVRVSMSTVVYFSFGAALLTTRRSLMAVFPAATFLRIMSLSYSTIVKYGVWPKWPLRVEVSPSAVSLGMASFITSSYSSKLCTELDSRLDR